jgi:Tetracyclin repressor-like, C-terminal domain
VPLDPQFRAILDTLQTSGLLPLVRGDAAQTGGLPDRVSAPGFDQLVLYVSASAYEAGLHRRADPAEIERYFAGVHAFYAALPPGPYPVLTAVAPDMTGPDADDRSEFGLNVLIAGLEAASAAENAQASAAGTAVSAT